MSLSSSDGTAPAREPAPGSGGGVTVARPIPRDDFRYLQALEDAITYRVARAGAPCADCDGSASGRCDDHDRDLELIGEYQAASLLCTERIAAATGTPDSASS